MVNQNLGVLTVDNEEVAEESFGNMNALALGVEAKYDLLTGYSKTVTERAIEMARKLGIPEREIQRWRIARLALHPLVYQKERSNGGGSRDERFTPGKG